MVLRHLVVVTFLKWQICSGMSKLKQECHTVLSLSLPPSLKMFLDVYVFSNVVLIEILFSLGFSKLDGVLLQ